MFRGASWQGVSVWQNGNLPFALLGFADGGRRAMRRIITAVHAMEVDADGDAI
jgi:hypothetical protein